MTVVADSSPLIALARAGYLTLLREFFDSVFIPKEVLAEIAEGKGLPGTQEIVCAEFIRVLDAPLEKPSASTVAYAESLGRGERAVLHLASSLPGSMVLIDERIGRRRAALCGFPVIGSMAILERGATAGRVSDLRSTYADLVRQGIRYDRMLLNLSLARLNLAPLP